MPDLSSSTNYIILKDLSGAYAVPRTSLSAVDLSVGPGITVTGNTIEVSEIGVLFEPLDQPLP